MEAETHGTSACRCASTPRPRRRRWWSSRARPRALRGTSLATGMAGRAESVKAYSVAAATYSACFSVSYAYDAAMPARNRFFGRVIAQLLDESWVWCDEILHAQRWAACALDCLRLPPDRCAAEPSSDIALCLAEQVDRAPRPVGEHEKLSGLGRNPCVVPELHDALDSTAARCRSARQRGRPGPWSTGWHLAELSDRAAPRQSRRAALEHERPRS